VTNKIILFVFLTALLLFCRPLWAQSQPSGSGHYVIEQRYVQNLVWIGDEYTLKYEVVIEQNEGDGADGEYKIYIQEFTEKPGFQVSLPVGKYRYRIIPYDYLEQPGEASDWVNIEIKPAPIAPVDEQITDDSAAEGEPRSTENDNPFDLYVNAAWAPLIPLYGRMSEIFADGFYAGGASVHFGALYNKLKWFSPGVELSMSWYALNTDQNGEKMNIQTGLTGLNIVAQIKIPRPRMAVTLRAGFAFAFQVGKVNVEDYSYSTGGLTPQLNADLSLLWFAYKQLYLEAGVGFCHFFDKENNSGCLRPRIGVGWQF